MNVLLQRQKNLIGVDWFYQIVGYLLSDGLVHYILLFTLRNHYDGRGWRNFLYLLQGFESGDSWHHLVEQHEVEIALTTLLYGVVAVVDGSDVVAFLLQKDNMGTQHLNLVVYPQQVSCSHIAILF